MGVTTSKLSKGLRSDSSPHPTIARLRIYSPRGTPSGNADFQKLLGQRRIENDYGGVSSVSMHEKNVETAPLIVEKDSRLELTSTEGMEPPLQAWIAPALCCAMAYALYNIFIKKGSSHINPVLGGVVLQIVAAILGLCLLLFLAVTEGGTEVISYDTTGIFYAVLAGLSVGMAEMISFFVSSLGVQANKSIPVIIGGSVLFGTLLGWLALNEELSNRAWFGVFLITIGISLVGMDN